MRSSSDESSDTSSSTSFGSSTALLPSDMTQTLDNAQLDYNQMGLLMKLILIRIPEFYWKRNDKMSIQWLLITNPVISEGHANVISDVIPCYDPPQTTLQTSDGREVNWFLKFEYLSTRNIKIDLITILIVIKHLQKIVITL